jgi:outer membrane protein OmpU
MKKLLLASTALFGTAGIVAADVAVTGNGRLGIEDTLVIQRAGDPDDPDFEPIRDDVGFTSRLRIIFTASGETDGGLSFGGSVRSDQNSSSQPMSAGSVFISGDFGTLTMGDVDGAAERAVGDVAGVGLTGLGFVNEAIYLSNNSRPAMRYDYSFGDFGVHISADNPEGDTEAYAVGLSGSFAGFTFGLGYEDLEYGAGGTLEIWGGDDDATVIGIPAGTDATHIIGGIGGTFAGFTGKAIYGQGELDIGGANVDLTQWQLSVGYSFDATSLTAFYSSLEFSDAVDADGEAWGVGVSYDLGGGASVRAGYVDAEFNGVSDDAFDFGVSMTF